MRNILTVPTGLGNFSHPGFPIKKTLSSKPVYPGKCRLFPPKPVQTSTQTGLLALRNHTPCLCKFSPANAVFTGLLRTFGLFLQAVSAPRGLPTTCATKTPSPTAVDSNGTENRGARLCRIGRAQAPDQPQQRQSSTRFESPFFVKPTLGFGPGCATRNTFIRYVNELLESDHSHPSIRQNQRPPTPPIFAYHSLPSSPSAQKTPARSAAH